MPELPEVELCKRNLEAWVLGRTLTEVSARAGTPLRNITGPRLEAGLKGKRVARIERIGKQLLLTLEPGDAILLVHLGMTGRFSRLSADQVLQPSLRMIWTLDDGSRIGFQDPRRFGRVRLLPAAKARAHPEIKKLGPDAYQLLEVEGGPGLSKRLKTTRTPIKVALMDQSLLAGLGNIYASEGLFRARISPRRPAHRVSKPEAMRLALGLLEAMNESLRLEAGEVIKYVQDAESQNHFQVYGREGEPCPRCHKRIKRTVQAGRSTFHCPGCQRR